MDLAPRSASRAHLFADTLSRSSSCGSDDRRAFEQAFDRRNPPRPDRRTISLARRGGPSTGAGSVPAPKKRPRPRGFPWHFQRLPYYRRKMNTDNGTGAKRDLNSIATTSGCWPGSISTQASAKLDPSGCVQQSLIGPPELDLSFAATRMRLMACYGGSWRTP